MITDLGLYRFDPQTKEMYLESYHPGLSVDDIKANVSWDIRIAPKVKVTKAPTKRELRVLRTKCDPEGVFLGK